MAISGVADTDVQTIANTLGTSREKVASLLGYTGGVYAAPALALAASGSSVGTLTGSGGWPGFVTIDWGDGTAVQFVTTTASAGVIPSTPHTYAATGSKTVTVSGYGQTKQVTQTIT